MNRACSSGIVLFASVILVVLCAIERGVDSAKIASPSMIVIYDEMNATI